MRASFPPPPSRDRLSRSPLHVLIRDFPELLPLFRSEGLDLTVTGAQPLASLLTPSGELLDRVEAALAWRGRSEGA